MEPIGRWSVVIPTHDTRELTCRCLESLAGEPGLEVIVVDDASRDGTREEIARRFPEVSVIRLERNAGFTIAANTGLEAARGDALLLLNSDTEVPASSWAPLRRALAAHPELGVAGARLVYGDDRRQWSAGPEPGLLWLFAVASGLGALPKPWRSWRGSEAQPDGAEPRPADWVSGAAMVIRRAVWAAVGPLDTRFAFYCQDLDFCSRARDAGWSVAVVDGFRVVHHHGATVSQDEGAVAHQNPELLWLDLLLWARLRRGRAWARRAARVLRLGASLRLAGHRVVELLDGRRRDREGARSGSVYRRALARLRAASAEL